MNITVRGSERIKAIGFVCALMVVAIHCAAIPKGWWDGSVDIPKWIVALQALGTDTLARLAVLWFFVFSGFFFAKEIRKIGEVDGNCLIWLGSLVWGCVRRRKCRGLCGGN